MFASVPRFFDDLHGDSWFNRNTGCALRFCFIEASPWQPMEAQGSESPELNSFITEFAPMISPACVPLPPHPLFSLICFGFRLLLRGKMLGMEVEMLILVLIFVSQHFISNKFVCKLIQFCLCQELVMDLPSFTLAHDLTSSPDPLRKGQEGRLGMCLTAR